MGKRIHDARRGPGRRPLRPGEYAVRRTITLPEELADYLTDLGNGNLSRGVRIAARAHRTNAQGAP
jgi:hypothetical protein